MDDKQKGPQDRTLGDTSSDWKRLQGFERFQFFISEFTLQETCVPVSVQIFSGCLFVCFLESSKLVSVTVSVSVCVLSQVVYLLQSLYGHPPRDRAAGLVQRLLHVLLRDPAAVRRSGRKL